MITRSFRLPDGGWVAESDRVEEAPMGYRIPEPAHDLVQLDARGKVARTMKPQVYSDCEILGCIVHAVRGTDLVATDWRRIDEEVPRRMDDVVARGLVEVPVSAFPFLAEAEAALGAG